MDFFLDILDKIIPLISTLLGALITYFVATSTKKEEIKLNSKIRARDEYWIPCSKAILDLKDKISLLAKNNNYVTFSNIHNSCEPQTTALLRYLDADKRIYFYKRTRELLQSVSTNIQTYENRINNDIESIIDIFCNQYYMMISNSSIYQNNNCSDCVITISKNLPDNIRTALCQHQKIDWRGHVASVIFFRGKPDYSSSFSAEFYCNDETDFFYDIWCRIHEGYNTRDDFGLSSEQNLGLDILDYENKHIKTLSQTLYKTIIEKDYHVEYLKIFESLSLLQDELYKNIDSATIL